MHRLVRVAWGIQVVALAGCGGGMGSDGSTAGGGSTAPPAAPSPTTVAITVASADSLFSLRDTARFVAVARDATGAAVASAPIVWSSSDPSVATVLTSSGGSTGVVAQANGVATISAASGGLVATKTLVVAQRAVGLTITTAGSDSIFALGDSRTLYGLVRDALGSSVSRGTVQWSVDRPDVAAPAASTGASVGATAVSNGAAIITATFGSLSRSVGLIVRQKVAQVTVAPASLALAPGTSATIAASARDTRGNAIPNLSAPTFNSSDASRATVSSGGLVTAVAAGTATITVSQASVDGTTTATVPVTIGAFPASASVDVADDQFIAATIDIAAGGTVTWTWKGFAAHDVTGVGADSPIHGPLQTSGTYRLTFATPGTFSYVCTQHQTLGMKGAVVVH